jgi:hypothetical protein
MSNSGLTRPSPKESRKFLPMFDRFEPVIQDHSAMKEFKLCPRKYFYRIVLGRVNKIQERSHILDFGTAYHKFREILDRDHLEWTQSVDPNKKPFDWGATFYKAMHAVKTSYKPDLTRASKDDQVIYSLERLMECCFVAFEYVKKEKNEGKFEVIAVEQPFNVNLPDDSSTGGRADCIVRWGGKLWDRDYKTTSKQAAWFMRGVDPNDQPTRYIYGISVLHGAPIGGAIFELMLNIKGKKPEIAPQIVTRSRYQLEQWERDQMMDNRVLAMYREEDHWPMHENNCNWCDYQRVCQAPNELSIAMKLKNEYNLKPWRMENVEQVAEVATK